MTAAERCLVINERLNGSGLFGGAKREVHEEQHSAWRISPEPIWISEDSYTFFKSLGPPLLSFYKAANNLYRASVRRRQPEWVREYLDMGKPETVVDYGRMNRFRHDLPFIIRPDILFTSEGPVATELDPVPGGIGLLAALSKYYSELGYEVVGGPKGMVSGFLKGIQSLLSEPHLLAIVVSDESNDYYDEMLWLAEALREEGLRAWTIRPNDIIFEEDGLFCDVGNGRERISVLYRFFELFDLKNIPKIDLMLYAVRKEKVVITPPLKSYLEEKLLFALFHHPYLKGFWLDEIGQESYDLLRTIFPQTWIMDPRPLPPQGIIPGLELGGRPVTDFHQLKDATKRERELVIKPSGFSELAWGSRGVSIGHDMSSKLWNTVVEESLKSLHDTPYILQKFHKSKQSGFKYYNFDTKVIKSENGRARFCPYYFVSGDEVELGGILATVCPLNKKIIHGMVDSVMAPVAVR